MRTAVALATLCGCGDNLDAGERWRTQIIDPAFRSEGVTVFDVDRDGVLDLVTSERWYRGPKFQFRNIRPPREFDPETEYSACYAAYHRDLDGDEYEDLIVIGAPGTQASWCANPRGVDQPWTCHLIAAPLAVETPIYAELFDGGPPVLIAGIEPRRSLALFSPGLFPDEPWIENPVSESGFAPAERYAHGLGVGDLNGDGRKDVITATGWLEQPVDRSDVPWPWHPLELCPDGACAGLFTDDVDVDGLQDIIGTSPHGYGVWWWQQPFFTRYQIDATLSQTHAAKLVDLDGDGRAELVTGKRWFVNFDQDPGALDPALLVAYRRLGTTWSREVLSEDVGVGSQFEIADVTGDRRLDIIVANKKGLAVVSRAGQ